MRQMLEPMPGTRHKGRYRHQTGMVAQRQMSHMLLMLPSLPYKSYQLRFCNQE